MLKLSTKSKSGRKARDPEWWGSFFQYYYPSVSFGFIDKLVEEKSWAADFIRGLPSKCPFERQLWLGDVLILHIPALCKFNPVFPQLMRLKVKLLQASEPPCPDPPCEIGGLDFKKDLS